MSSSSQQHQQHQHQQQQQPLLSNATYRRNTRRHHHQQKINQSNEKRRKIWGMFLNKFRLRSNNSAGYAGGVGNYFGSSSSSSSSSSYSNLNNSFFSSTSSCLSKLSSSSSTPTSTFNSTTPRGNKNKTQRIVISLLLSLFILWSYFICSMVVKSKSLRNGTSTNNGSSNGSTNTSIGIGIDVNSSKVIQMKDVKPKQNQYQQEQQQQRQQHQKSKQKNNKEIIIQQHEKVHQMKQLRPNGKEEIQQIRNEEHLSETGAWANCKMTESDSQHQHQHQPQPQHQKHPDQRTTTVSCHTIQYRIKKSTFAKIITSHNEIVIGVLSSAGAATNVNAEKNSNIGDNEINKNHNDNTYEIGYQRRQSIRETWAKDQTGIFFLVAQPFDFDYTNDNNETSSASSTSMIVSSLEKEYDTYGDLIWINESEAYEGENSVLTYKTLSFVNIVHDLAIECSSSVNSRNGNSGTGNEGENENGHTNMIKYLFKTDDDSYVHIQNLHNHLLSQPSKENGDNNNNDNNNHNDNDDKNRRRDYYGRCKDKQVEPSRLQSNKWPVSYDLYPEKVYPRYCQGAGFALSWKLIQCAASSSSSSSSGSIIANARYMPFEDVAMGLIAERCNVQPTNIENEDWIHMYRFGRSEEVWRVNQGMERMPKHKLPKPNMDGGRFVQHRIYDDWDMKEHHKISINKKKYEAESKVEWYYRPDVEEGNE